MVESVSSAIGHTATRAAQVAARRNELLEVAWQVINVDGERVSMDRIATAAGITRPVLYRHFGDIAGLYLAVAERFAALLDTAFQTLPPPTAGRALLEATVDAYTRTIDEHPQIYRYLTRRTGPEQTTAGDTVRDFTRLLGNQLTAFFEAAGVAPTLAAVRGHSLVGGIQATGDWWLDTRPVSRSEIVQHLTDVLWHGHRGDADRNR